MRASSKQISKQARSPNNQASKASKANKQGKPDKQGLPQRPAGAGNLLSKLVALPGKRAGIVCVRGAGRRAVEEIGVQVTASSRGKVDRSDVN